MVQKGPKISGAIGAGNHHQMSPHIFNMSLQPFFATWAVPGTWAAPRVPTLLIIVHFPLLNSEAGSTSQVATAAATRHWDP